MSKCDVKVKYILLWIAWNKITRKRVNCRGAFYLTWIYLNPSVESVVWNCGSIPNFSCVIPNASMLLTHWSRVAHICVSKHTIIGSDNGLAPGRRQTIICTNDGILLIEPLGTNFSAILIGIQTFSFNKMHLKMSSAKWRPFCLGPNVLIGDLDTIYHYFVTIPPLLCDEPVMIDSRLTVHWSVQELQISWLHARQ